MDVGRVTMSKKIAYVFGAVFLLFAAIRAFQDSDMLLGLFHVDRTHNMIHFVSGILGILAGMAGMYWSRLYLWAVGLMYLAVCVAGFIAGQVMEMPLNTADNFLHLAISAVALYAVFAESPYLGSERSIPITGRRGVTDFREPQPRY
jgi:hypothetical protein